MQYLFLQTGQALQEMNPDSEQTAELIEDLNVEEREEDEGFCDIHEDHTIQDLDVVLSPLSTLTLGSATSVLGSSAPSLVPDTSVLPQSLRQSPGPLGTDVLPVVSEPSDDLPVQLEFEDAGQEGDEEMVCSTPVFLNKQKF